MELLQMWQWLVGDRAAVPGPVIFIHIPKTAGSTLNQVIKGQYPADRTVEIDAERQPESLERFKQLPLAQRDRMALLRGHFGFGLHTLFSRPATYITILRDPIERVISHYYYLRRIIKNGAELTHRPWLREATKMSLQEYVLHAPSADLRNGQTKALAGSMSGWDPDGEPPVPADRLLDTAKQNLRDRIAVVGLTERFDETLILLRRELGWSAPFYTSKNVTKAKPGREKIDRGVIAALEAANSLDLELYRFAEQRFEAAIAEQTESFARELRWFRFMNARYQQVRRVQRSVQYRTRRLQQWRAAR